MSIENNIDPDVEYSLLSGQDKAAILLSSLGVTTTQLIFTHLRDNDVKRMINAMSTINKAPIWMLKRVLEEFYSHLNEESDLLFSENRGRDFIINALGEDRAKQLLGQIVDVGTSNTLESLELVDTRTLANFLINEHPQTIALIVAHLNPERKVDVLRRLPEGLQAEVVFEDLVYVDDKGIQSILKEVDQQKLVIALKTANDEIKAKLFKNMSNRAATLLMEDLETLGPTKLSDVEKAQAEIVQKCKELESQGKAFINRGGDGDALV